MRRLKCYGWTLLILLSVMLIASEIDAELDEVITFKLFGFLCMILGGWRLRKYRDIMDKDIEKLEDMLDAKYDDDEMD